MVEPDLSKSTKRPRKGEAVCAVAEVLSLIRERLSLLLFLSVGVKTVGECADERAHAMNSFQEDGTPLERMAQPSFLFISFSCAGKNEEKHCTSPRTGTNTRIVHGRGVGNAEWWSRAGAGVLPAPLVNTRTVVQRNNESEGKKL